MCSWCRRLANPNSLSADRNEKTDNQDWAIEKKKQTFQLTIIQVKTNSIGKNEKMKSEKST